METNYQLIKTKLLKKKAKAVTQEDLLYPERLKQIVLDLFGLMINHKAAGIAANQCGINRQICLIRDGRGVKFLIFINPVIVKSTPQTASNIEVCMSFPGDRRRMVRAKAVTVRTMDFTGKFRNIKFRGNQAASVQHEIDHLNGLTILRGEKVK